MRCQLHDLIRLLIVCRSSGVSCGRNERQSLTCSEAACRLLQRQAVHHQAVHLRRRRPDRQQPARRHSKGPVGSWLA